MGLASRTVVSSGSRLSIESEPAAAGSVCLFTFMLRPHRIARRKLGPPPALHAPWHETQPAKFRSGNRGTDSGFAAVRRYLPISEGDGAMFTRRNAWPTCNALWAPGSEGGSVVPKWRPVQRKIPQSQKVARYYPGEFVAAQRFPLNQITPQQDQWCSVTPTAGQPGGTRESRPCA